MVFEKVQSIIAANKRAPSRRKATGSSFYLVNSIAESAVPL